MVLNMVDRDINVRPVDMYSKIKLVRKKVSRNKPKNYGIDTVIENKHTKN
jgi:hypothetical protein